MAHSTREKPVRTVRKYAERLGSRQHLLPLDVLVVSEIARLVAEEGRSAVSCGVVALASAVDAPRRSVERSLARLREAGYITSRERGRGLPATITLTKREALPMLPASPGKAPRVAQPIAMASGAPIGFIGDLNALQISRILARVRPGDVSPIDFATRYLEHITPAEAMRLETLRDENALYQEGRAIVGDPAIDEGLRQLAIRDYQKRGARKFVATLGTFEDPLAD